MANILRKRAIIARNQAESANRNEDLKDLYVFGYQCKLFRDDERAMVIDQGKHLIPWMDNDKLMIDRYDGRGHLHDLSEYDSELCRSLVEPLTDEERQIEALCDEERYLELNSDILEKMLYEEEELKRLNEALATDGSYTAVGFSYGDSNGEPTEAQNSSEACEEDEDSRPYVPIPELQLSASIKTPTTAKMHAIIERTAVFIAKHGVQMEIMMKTKQKDNPQFGFLNYEDELNAYYQHLVLAIKQNKYTPASTAQQSSAGEHAYLHPSLASSASLASVNAEPPQQDSISSQEFLESISSKLPAGQIANTPYAKLLSNLSRHRLNASPKPSDLTSNGSSRPGSRAGSQEKTLPSVRSAPVLQHVGQRSLSPCSSSSTVLSSHGVQQPPVPGIEPVALPARTSSSVTVAAPAKPEIEQVIHGPAIVPPAPDIQPIIDKMADYVARNGPEFEIVVRRRNDARFQFIEPGHPHHAYYTHKRNIFIAEIEKKKAAEESGRAENGHPEKDCLVTEGAIRLSGESQQCVEKEQTVEKPVETSEKDEKCHIKGVSFMIKAKEEETPMLTMTALPYESSDDEDNEENDEESDTSEAIPTSSKVPFSHQASTQSSVSGAAAALSKQTLQSSAANNSASSTIETVVPLLSDAKKHDRLADRLASIAREKATRASREKHLQEQRKRKAAAFLTLLKQSDEAPDAEEAAADWDTLSTSAAASDIPPSPLSSLVARSRSSTPAACHQVPPVAAALSASSPFVEKLHGNTGGTSSASRRALSPPPTKPLETVRHRRHRSKSPKRHHRHTSPRSRSPHRKRAASPSRKHHKRDKKLPSAYAVKRSTSRSPKRKVSDARSPSHSSRHIGVDATDAGRRLTVSSKHSKYALSSSSAMLLPKRHHKKSDDRERRRRSEKKSHKSKRSRRDRSSRSSSSSSSRSPSPVRRRLRRLSDNLIDLTIADQQDSSGSTHSSPVIVNGKQSAVKVTACSELSEVQALLKARREQLLKEDVVILD